MTFNRSPGAVHKVDDRSSSTGETRLRVFAGVAVLLATATVGVAVVFGNAMHWGELLLLGALLVSAEHRDRLFGDETSASGSIVVAMAAVTVFSNGPWLAGPMMCAGLAGAYWPHLRSHAWSRVAVNAASMSMAAATSAVIVHLAGPATNDLGLRAATVGVAAVLGFWIVNSLVLGIAVATIQGRSLWGVWRGLVLSETELLAFAYAGLLVGYVFRAAPMWAGALGLVGLLAALDLLVMRRPRSTPRELMGPAIATLVVVVAAVWLGLAESPRLTPRLAVLLGLSLVAAISATRRRDGFSLFAGLLLATAASVSGGPRGMILVPLALGLVAFVVPVSRRRTVAKRLSVIGGGGTAALAAAGVIALLPAQLHSSFVGNLLAGALGAVTALVAWHAAIGLTFMLTIGRNGFRAILDIARGDLAFALMAGVCAAVSTQVGIEWGAAGLATSLFGQLAIAWIVTRESTESGNIAATFTDADLLDVLHSAVLDVPASRVPD
jgi:hypothetical protein